jgi:hypothetical protein
MLRVVDLFCYGDYQYSPLYLLRKRRRATSAKYDKTRGGPLIIHKGNSKFLLLAMSGLYKIKAMRVARIINIE